jgi:hypothetical protein
MNRKDCGMDRGALAPHRAVTNSQVAQLPAISDQNREVISSDIRLNGMVFRFDIDHR